MNEHMKEKDPDDPVIAVFDTVSKRLVYTDQVSIVDNDGAILGYLTFTPKGVKGLPHEVRACLTMYNSYNTRLINEQT